MVNHQLFEHDDVVIVLMALLNYYVQLNYCQRHNHFDYLYVRIHHHALENFYHVLYFYPVTSGALERISISFFYICFWCGFYLCVFFFFWGLVEKETGTERDRELQEKNQTVYCLCLFFERGLIGWL